MFSCSGETSSSAAVCDEQPAATTAANTTGTTRTSQVRGTQVKQAHGPTTINALAAQRPEDSGQGMVAQVGALRRPVLILVAESGIEDPALTFLPMPGDGQTPGGVAEHLTAQDHLVVRVQVVHHVDLVAHHERSGQLDHRRVGALAVAVRGRARRPGARRTCRRSGGCTATGDRIRCWTPRAAPPARRRPGRTPPARPVAPSGGSPSGLPVVLTRITAANRDSSAGVNTRGSSVASTVKPWARRTWPRPATAGAIDWWRNPVVREYTRRCLPDIGPGPLVSAADVGGASAVPGLWPGPATSDPRRHHPLAPPACPRPSRLKRPKRHRCPRRRRSLNRPSPGHRCPAGPRRARRPVRNFRWQRRPARSATSSCRRRSPRPAKPAARWSATDVAYYSWGSPSALCRRRSSARVSSAGSKGRATLSRPNIYIDDTRSSSCRRVRVTDPTGSSGIALVANQAQKAPNRYWRARSEVRYSAPRLTAMGETLPGTGIKGDVLAGRVVGPYRVLYRLGSGGMGAVYVAEHLLLERKVALKILAPVSAEDPEQAERFLLEARSASRIRHENVVEIFDLGQSDDGHVYIAMELLEGADLEAVLRHEGALSWRRARYVAQQIAAALQAAHQAGIIHRRSHPAERVRAGRSDRSDQAAGLRGGQADRGHRPAPDPGRPGLWHARLHGTRADRGAPGRSADGRLRPGLRALSHGDRDPAVRGRHHHGPAAQAA